MMNSPDNLGVLSDLPLNPSALKDNLEEEKSTSHASANLRQMEIKREILANAGIIALTGIALVPLFGSLLPQESPPQYEGKFQFVVEPLINQGKQVALANTGTPEWTIDYETQARVLWSPKVISPIVRRLQATYPDLTTETLLHNLTVTHEPGSSRLSVTYRDFDREKTQVILNQLAQSYIQISQECHSGSCRAVQFIDQRLPQLQQQMAELKQRLKSLQQSTGITDPNQFGQYLTQRVQMLSQQQNQLQIQMIEARTRAFTLQQQLGLGLGNQLLADKLLQQHPRYQTLLEQLRQIVQQSLVSMHSQSDSSSSRILQQRYQQIYAELVAVVQETALGGISAIQAQNQLAGDSPELRLQTLQEWVGVTHQMRIIGIQQQAIAQFKQQSQTRVQQWAVFARKYAATQLELQTANSKLELYQHRKKELSNQPDARLLARLVTPPEMVEVTRESSWFWADVPLPLELTASLSFFLLLLALAATKKPEIAGSNQQPATVQPGSTPQKCIPNQWIGLTYYRWLFEKLASNPTVSFDKPSLAPSFKPIFSSFMGAGLVATTVSGLAIAHSNHQDTKSVSKELAPIKEQSSNQSRFHQVVVASQWGFKPTAPETIGSGSFSSTKLVQHNPLPQPSLGQPIASPKPMASPNR